MEVVVQDLDQKIDLVIPKSANRNAVCWDLSVVSVENACLDKELFMIRRMLNSINNHF